MNATIREYRPSDEPVVVEFALRAWAPVFASMESVLGAELSGRLHGGEDGWRGYQETAIRRALTDASMHTWVAEVEAIAVGFVTAHLTGDRRIGEVFMLAVDPRQQGQGTGTALTDVATDWLRKIRRPRGVGGDRWRPWSRAGPACLREGRLHGVADSPLLQGPVAVRVESGACRTLVPKRSLLVE